MVNRKKRLEKAIESLKIEIEKHFEKLDKDINEENTILAGYHVKEIDKSLILALERKIISLGENIKDIELIKNYKKRLNKYRDKLGNRY